MVIHIEYARKTAKVYKSKSSFDSFHGLLHPWFWVAKSIGVVIIMTNARAEIKKEL